MIRMSGKNFAEKAAIQRSRSRRRTDEIERREAASQALPRATFDTIDFRRQSLVKYFTKSGTP
jgi:hypothetical protein